MIKKIISGISLALVAVLAPLCFVGCKSNKNPSKLVGTYTFTSLQVYIGDNQIDLEKADEVAQLSDYMAKPYEYVSMAMGQGVGFTLNKNGTIDLSIPTEADKDASAEAAGAIETINDFKDKVGDMIDSLSWFARKDKVYVSGKFTGTPDSEGSDPNAAEVVTVDNLIGIILTVKGKTLTVEFTTSVYGEEKDESGNYPLVTERMVVVLERA